MKDTAKSQEELLQEIAELRRVLGELRSAGGSVERRFRSLIEHSFDVIKIIDAKGEVRYISPSVEHVLGYKAGQVIGRSSFEFLHPDDHEKAREILKRIVERAGVHYAELRVIHRDGSTRTMECVAKNLIDDPTIEGIVLNYRDITERTAAEEALRRSEEKFSKSFHSSPDSVTLSAIADGRFIDVNEGFERITGYRRDEIVGKTSLELGLWEDPGERANLIRLLLEEGSVRNFEVKSRVKNGDIRTCLVSADTIQLKTGTCLITVTRDVTEERDAEILLWDIAERLKLEREESSEKDIALRQVLAHIENERAACRREVVASVENLLRPILAKLKKKGGRNEPGDVSQLEKDLHATLGNDGGGTHGSMTTLTPREADVCECIKSGLSSKEIAQKLGLSPQTVHKHRQVIRRKLQLSNTSVNLSAFLRHRSSSDGGPATHAAE